MPWSQLSLSDKQSDFCGCQYFSNHHIPSFSLGTGMKLTSFPRYNFNIVTVNTHGSNLDWEASRKLATKCSSRVDACTGSSWFPFPYLSPQTQSLCAIACNQHQSASCLVFPVCANECIDFPIQSHNSYFRDKHLRLVVINLWHVGQLAAGGWREDWSGYC